MRYGCVALVLFAAGFAGLFFTVFEAPSAERTLAFRETDRRTTLRWKNDDLLPVVSTWRNITRVRCRSDADLCWSPGGVVGPSEDDVDRDLDELVRRYTLRVRAAITPPLIRSAGEAVPLVDSSGITWNELSAVVVDLANEFSQRFSHPSTDCMFQLMPYQRAACVVLVGMDMSDAKDTWVDSYCHAYVNCLVWQRGTFARPVTRARLDREFDELVQGHERSLAHDFISNFVMSDLLSSEFAFFSDRTRTQEVELAKRHARLQRRRLLNPLLEGLVKRKQVMWDESVTDLRPVFQGQDFRYDFDRRTATIHRRKREGGDDHADDKAAVSRMPVLTPLQVLAILFQRAKLRNPRVDADLPTAATKRLLNIIAFSGDSMNREVFMRLVHYLRYGVGPSDDPPTEGTQDEEHEKGRTGQRRQHAFHEPSQHHDMIYAVYESHDEMIVKHSPMSDYRSDITVAQYFQAIKQKVRLHRRGKLARPPEIALLYVVYFWDPTTEWNRQELVVDVKFLGHDFLKKFSGDAVKASIGLKRNNSAGTAQEPQLLVGEAAREKRMHLGKKQIVLPLDPRLPCLIRIHVPRLKITRNFDVRNLLIGQRAAQPRWPRPNKSVGASPSPATAACPDDMIQLAEQFRVHMTRQEHMKYAPRPVIPLRELGIGVAVHVQGNVFWETEHYPEMFQHFFLASIALNSEVPELQDVPRRAIPDDDTDLYFMTASYSEMSEPFFRHLMAPVSSSWPSRQEGRNGTANNGTEEESTLRVLGENDHLDLDEDEPEQQLLFAEEEEEGDRERERNGEGARHTSRDESSSWVVNDTLLLGLPMPDSNAKNLQKNVHMYRWFRQLLQARNRRFPVSQQDGDRGDSFRYFASVNLLELGKVQFLRFRQGDDKHLACRFAQVRDRRKFDLGFDFPSLFYLLSSGEHHLNKRSIGRIAGRGGGDAANVTVYSIVQLLHRMFVNAESTGMRDALWNSSGMASAVRDVKIGNIFLLGDTSEYGVLVHDDGARCGDDGNLFLLQSLAWDLLEKQSRRVRGAT